MPFSSSDFPGQLSAVLFCQGCPWRCRYCHNPHLQDFRQSQIDFEMVLEFLKERQGLLDAVVFSGGEASYQSALLPAISAVRQLGYKIGLHSAAPSFELFETVLPHLDWIGLDIKAGEDAYPSITGTADSADAPYRALSLLLESGLRYEVRTTYHPSLVSKIELLALAQKLFFLGVRNYAVQCFRKTGCRDEELVEQAIDADLVEKLSSLFDTFILRN